MDGISLKIRNIDMLAILYFYFEVSSDYLSRKKRDMLSWVGLNCVKLFLTFPTVTKYH